MEHTKVFLRYQTKVDELDEDVSFIDTNVGTLRNTLGDVLLQVNALTSQVGSVGMGITHGPGSSSAALSISSVIVDDAGVPVTSVGKLLGQLVALETENARMRSMDHSQGGITVGLFTFSSINELEAVMDRYQIFVDISTLHIHNPNVDPGNSTSLLD